ncbi:cell wall-binding repeat-containing protein, partial [Stomatohabitans albus]|uniref:cell wall-binding repeat-containing protein n=1 Tax=Stomatohabitans albus TaxID=3110766 RepID=UPI00300C1A47
RIVLIGRDNVFADSLSSGGLQGMLDAPLLLNPVDRLSDRTKQNLDRLQPEQVILLGGPVAQSVVVEAELKRLGWNVSRVHGPTRIETAIDAARVHAPGAVEGVLARAYASDWGSGTQAFADALGGGAFAARTQRPVFLTESGVLTESLRAYLVSSKIRRMTIIGSSDAVSPQVEVALRAMGIVTTRIAGDNRAQTAVRIANALGYWNAGEAESALVVNGEHEDAWTDAFPAALFA